MLLSTFFEHIKHHKTLPAGDVFCFTGKAFPLLFFYHLISFFKKNSLSIEPLSCVDMDTGSIKAQLSTMSFSGNKTYWLESFSALPAKKQQDLLDYTRNYRGPHHILLFSDAVLKDGVVPTALSTSAMNIIILPEDITIHDFYRMRFLVNTISHDKTAFGSRLSMYTDYLSLDTVCLFAHYEVVLGRSVDDFFDQWMIHITEPTVSLFDISQYFFSKKTPQFFRRWVQMSALYLPPFWATFWADQIWRAYVFCDLMKQKKYTESKKAQYKLPFSFINRDWSSYSLVELRNAHDALTKIDYQLKNGSSEIGLEHFYTQFFENKFR